MKQELVKQYQPVEGKAVKEGRKVIPICYICNKVPEQGLRSGFFLRGIFICHDCEESLIKVDSHDKDDYLLALAKLKSVLFPY